MRAKTSGVKITDQIADDLAAEAEEGYDLSKAKRRKVGRPSLENGRSPRLQFRLSSAQYSSAKRVADEQGRPLSEVARDALVRYLKEHSA